MTIMFQIKKKISTKAVITIVHEKLRKSSFMFLSKIQMLKDIFKRPKNQLIITICKLLGSIILNFKSRQRGG